MEFLVEQDRPGRWKWRLIGRRGMTIMRSDEYYMSCVQAAAAATAFARMVTQASKRVVNISSVSDELLV